MDSSNKKRPNGYGTVYQRPNGRWCAQFYSRDSLGYGKRRALFAATEEEAWQKLDAALPDEIKGADFMSRPVKRTPFDTANPHVYLVQATIGGPVKIGVAKDPDERLQIIQLHCPFELKIVNLLAHAGYDVESFLHRRLQKYRLHGEWFEDHQKVHEWFELIKDPNTRPILEQPKSWSQPW